MGGLGDLARIRDFLGRLRQPSLRHGMRLNTYFEGVYPVPVLVQRVHEMHGGREWVVVQGTVR